MINRIKNWLKGERLSIQSKEEGGPFFEYNESEVVAYKERFKDISMDEVKVPDIPGVNSNCIVARWYKKDGDKIRKGDILCELDLSNSFLEFESYLDGYIYFRRVPGTSLKPGSFLCLLLSRQPY